MNDTHTDRPQNTTGPAPTGAAAIAAIVKRLPNTPGVYRMIDAAGEPLYVGKARNLKKRVQSYTRPASQNNRIARMIRATASMEFVQTATEAEALLLEANLIKRLRPRFNVLLRDDKSFPYILIAEDHAAPQILKHRGARKRKGTYFGPFASAGAVNRTINALQKAFLLRSCSDALYDSRSRPCLLYQIKRCAAPCTGEIDIAAYRELVREARLFLSGKSRAIRAELVEGMERAAERLDFEQAAILRDRIAALSHIQAHQDINARTIVEADVFAIHQQAGHNSIQVFFFRSGQNWGNRAYFPRADRSLDEGEVLESFLAQFYDDRPVPRLILLSHPVAAQDLLAEALSARAGRRLRLSVPRRGEKKNIVDHALLNAREALARRLAETSSQTSLLEGVARVFDLDEPPRRIEVFDNSHIMGAHAIGAMIVAARQGFVKNQYRKFNIRATDLAPGDDYGMMREVLKRRYSRLLREAPPQRPHDDDDTLPAWPDLVLIDGGRGHLNAALEALADIGIDDLPLVGIAKGRDRDAGRERFFLPERDSFTLPVRDPVLYFVQRLRDEAHRFAIGAHRARRSRAIATTPLDEIPGIGAGRKRALLHHFGTARAVARAGLADLEAVPGISARIARAIYDHFHENR